MTKTYSLPPSSGYKEMPFIIWVCEQPEYICITDDPVIQQSQNKSIRTEVCMVIMVCVAVTGEVVYNFFYVYELTTNSFMKDSNKICSRV